jgi:type II secretory pathway component PulC
MKTARWMDSKFLASRVEVFFKILGLQNGDVINNINGTQIDSLEKALPMLQLLKTESSYTIDITRKGSKQSMNINIQ